MLTAELAVLWFRPLPATGQGRAAHKMTPAGRAWCDRMIWRPWMAVPTTRAGLPYWGLLPCPVCDRLAGPV